MPPTPSTMASKWESFMKTAGYAAHYTRLAAFLRNAAKRGTRSLAIGAIFLRRKRHRKTDRANRQKLMCAALANGAGVVNNGPDGKVILTYTALSSNRKNGLVSEAEHLTNGSDQ
jgi:hypothetical protein